jgi:ubiquinol-cytochrome c reductase cytochrome b subunit
LLGWAGLTAAAVVTTPKPDNAVAIDYGAPTDWLGLSPEELAGIGYFRKENCASCHAFGAGKASVGPDLANVPIKKTAAWMIAHFKRPSAMVPGSSMPAIQLSDAQLNALAAFLLKLNPRNADALANAPDFAVNGALIYQSSNCGSCHQVNGVGMTVGPPLNGLPRRRSKDWVVRHFADPAAMSPGSFMPPYRFSNRQMDDLVAYLFTLPE